MRVRILYGAVLPLVVVAVVGCRSDSKSTPQPVAENPSDKTEAAGVTGSTLRIDREMLRDLRITTSKVEEHRGGESASLLGELGVNQNAYAEVSAPMTARVVSLRAVEGQRVGTGDVLAILESGDLAKARGDLATAEARRDLAQRTLERKRSLNEEKIVPTREVQEAENEMVAADAQVRAAQAALRALGAPDQAAQGNSPSSLILRSPIGGVVLERTVALGQTADPSKPLFRIGDLSILWLTVHAFERDAVRLAKGVSARITFAAIPGRTFQGTVALIGQSVNPDSRTVAVRIDLPNRDGLLRPGMSATASWLRAR